jgi:hypothetical protein
MLAIIYPSSSRRKKSKITSKSIFIPIDSSKPNFDKYFHDIEVANEEKLLLELTNENLRLSRLLELKEFNLETLIQLIIFCLSFVIMIYAIIFFK